jgi:hypothetical protein
MSARPGAGGLAAPLGEDREVGADALDVLRDAGAVAPDVRPDREVFLHGQMRKDTAAFRTVRNARAEDGRGLEPVNVPAGEDDTTAPRAEETRDGAQGR